MSDHGEKKNSDKLNMVGIATVGFAGSAVVYLSIVGIQALYLNETSRVDEVANFGRQGATKDTLKAEQVGKIGHAARAPKAPNGNEVFVVPIDTAISLVVRDAAIDPANLVPAVSRSEFTTIKPAFGRPQNLPAAQPLGQSAPVTPPVDPTAPPVDPTAPVVPATGETPAATGAAAPTGAAVTPAVTPTAAPATTGAVPPAAAPR